MAKFEGPTYEAGAEGDELSDSIVVDVHEDDIPGWFAQLGDTLFGRLVLIPVKRVGKWFRFIFILRDDSGPDEPTKH